MCGNVGEILESLFLHCVFVDEPEAFTPIYTEHQRQCCGVTNDIAQIKLHRFLINEASHSENGLQPHVIRYDTSIDVNIPNQSLVLSVNEP